jgi:lipopolysaccharide/colanic/teichoic acid biosynthesis glycosyltransferase
MSLVGPRPELPYLVEQYAAWQRRRFTIPPGITGWWQVNGRSDKPMHLHTEDDLYYVQNYSLWLDLQILAKTIFAVIGGKGAF